MVGMDKEFLERFAGVGRLYGRAGLERLAASSFMVVGLGGVGSWTAEALARSGVGSLTLVDGDTVCASNTNRQLHAVAGAAGRAKTEAVAERAHAIRPGIRTELRTAFVTRANAAETVAGFTGVVVDAIDALSPKCALLDACRRAGLRTVSAGGCAGRTDGTRIRVTDLAQSREDALLMLVRKRLRQNFDFPRKGPFGISCVWSDELPAARTDCDGLPGGEMPEDEELRPNCEWGYGTAAHVAGAFGLAAAGEAIRLCLAAQE